MTVKTIYILNADTCCNLQYNTILKRLRLNFNCNIDKNPDELNETIETKKISQQIFN
jgi:hypothetical protein